jgi:hypothetical protein
VRSRFLNDLEVNFWNTNYVSDITFKNNFCEYNGDFFLTIEYNGDLNTSTRIHEYIVQPNRIVDMLLPSGILIEEKDFFGKKIMRITGKDKLISSN